MAVDIQQIGSVYDSLESKIKATLDEQWGHGRLTGSDYAQVLSSTITQAMQLAVQSVQNQSEIDAKIAETNAQTSLLGSQKSKVDSDKLIAEAQSAKDLELKDERKTQIIAQTYLVNTQKSNAIKHGLQMDENLSLLTDEHPYKVQMIANQVAKINSDKQLVDEQKNGITQQVIDNRKIKALNSLANTYGVFGSGGLTLSTDMWSTYFNIVSDLTGGTVPSNTTVAKVT